MKNYDYKEYQEQIRIINNIHQNSIKILNSEFAKANNKLKIGDIATDHIGSIKIESFKVWVGRHNELPSIVYNGLELKKDSTPMKRNSKRDVYQCNLLDKSLR